MELKIHSQIIPRRAPDRHEQAAQDLVIVDLGCPHQAADGSGLLHDFSRQPTLQPHGA
jgi:hypothetical protein